MINWVGVLEYCQWAAANGLLVTNLFSDERQDECPKDYDGPATQWPSRQEAFQHFCENPDAWELVKKGYEWRSFGLWDQIEGVRKRLAKGSIEPRRASVLLTSLMSEIKLTAADALKERREAEKVSKAAAKAADADVKPVTIAERLAEATDVARRASRTTQPKRKPPKGVPATEWGSAGNA